MKDFFYELKHKNGDTEIIYKFNADLDNYKLQENLQYFLLSCGWNEKILNGMFNTYE